MNGRCFVVLEAHARSATLYLQGELAPAEIDRAVALCASLPREIATLRIDARGVPAANVALHTIVGTLEHLWAVTRGCRIDGQAVLAAASGSSPCVVTASLHDRAEPVTGSGHYPGDRTRLLATPA